MNELRLTEDEPGKRGSILSPDFRRYAQEIGGVSKGEKSRRYFHSSLLIHQMGSGLLKCIGGSRSYRKSFTKGEAKAKIEPRARSAWYLLLA
ncbi:hypothetical protein [Reticulibacter mediterranei]|uniref:hypothetical protein n=1 Tax=Reticulibacter mediterranei TaxID=2778369 RepID=UPI001C68A88B|nr:hypothetical protein [Reticulibacter mediterranei]